MAHAYHPTNTKRGVVCIYRKKCLPLRVLNIFKWINKLELRIGNSNFIVLNRSPSQCQDVFESFCGKFERILNYLIQNNPFLLVAMGEFYAKLTKAKNHY